jgi:hypothetical protein
MKVAEESAARIIERAWEATRAQISEVDRLWREVQAEIVRFAAWRQHIDPLIGAVQGYIDEAARARLDEVPRRIQEALSPAAEALAAVDAGMSEFAQASDLPELLGRLHEVAETIEPERHAASGSEAVPGRDASSDPEEDLVGGADVCVDRSDADPAFGSNPAFGSEPGLGSEPTFGSEPGLGSTDPRDESSTPRDGHRRGGMAGPFGPATSRR